MGLAAQATMPTVLLVEPHVDLLGALSQSLLTMGYRVHTARSGSAAASCAAIAPGPIDLLVAEVELPDFSALYLVDHLRSSHAELRVLLTSWQRRDHLRALGHELGELTLLKKPLRLSVFQARVRELSAPRSDPRAASRTLVLPRPPGG